MQRVGQPGYPMSARMAVVAKYADSISAPSKDLERTAVRFAERMVSIDSGVKAAPSLIMATPCDQRDQEAKDFLNS